ncbi:concanavalin A-like lectin/glucanase domain-containing protein [Ampelomyces quisqualis]|uniref:Crh-like protein n=1 Tax=Ampelomyces quisqualis TaxID=50730 RepID=A0A6A5QVP2_AMPQU|nr:concanavalin A-like lectin/glucanase domain-containing protein [Ampelomyces quisqualis]
MRFTTYAAAATLVTLATGQTFTDCNPMEKECPNDPAMPATFETDFKAGKDAVKGWKQTAGSLTYGPKGAEFIVAKPGDAPTIQSEGFLHFGYVEVKMTAAKGQGIISSIVLQSQDLDEVDWEWIGGQEGKVQLNYFGKGNTTTYDRMIEAPVATTQTETHTYALNWTAEAITWIIDGEPKRTLKYADANGGKTFPQTPCNVRLGNWPGGDSKDKGTVEWAGGKVDYKAAPFTMTVESVKVINYSPGTAYKWTDKSGSHESIEVIGAGNKNGAPQNAAVIEPSATAPGKPLESAIDAPGKTTGPAGSTSGTPAKPSSGAVDTRSERSDDLPCNCGTATMTVSGTPPASFTTANQPPYPTSGLLVETNPAPVVPVPNPSAPSGALPTLSGNATISAPPSQFTGAASHNKAGVLVGAFAGAVLLAF